MESAELTAGQRTAFLCAGLQTITVQGRESRFTYKLVPKKSDEQVRWVYVLNGADNSSDYAFLGGLYPNGSYYYSDKAKVTADAPSAKAFAWFWSHQEDARLRVFLSRPCRICGGKLTVPESILRGMGPECASRNA